DGHASIHLSDWPKAELAAIEKEHSLVAEMDKVQDICNAVHAIRNQQNIRVRQPLASLVLVGKGLAALPLFEQLIFEKRIEEEVNVKESKYASNVEDFAEYKLMLNFPVIGKKYSTLVQRLSAAVKAGNWGMQGAVVSVDGIVLEEEDYVLKLQPLEGALPCQPLPWGEALVALDTAITPELEAEGLARDVLRLIQQSRK